MKIIFRETARNFNRDVQSEFVGIVEQRKILGNAIVNLLTENKTGKSEKELEIEVKDANSKAVRIVDSLYRCGALMTAETKMVPTR